MVEGTALCAAIVSKGGAQENIITVSIAHADIENATLILVSALKGTAILSGLLALASKKLKMVILSDIMQVLLKEKLMTAGRWQSLAGFVLGFTVGFIGFRRAPIPTEITDPEILLQLAQQEMRESQAKNRERAVQAITQKNNLQALVDQTQKRIDGFQERVEFARWKGDDDLERQLLSEQAQYTKTLEKVQVALQTAIVVTESIKVAMRRQEEHVRAKTAQALAMKAQWQVISWSLVGDKLVTDHSEQYFQRAQARIDRQAQRNWQGLTAQIQTTCEHLLAESNQALREGNEVLAKRLLAEHDALLKHRDFVE